MPRQEKQQSCRKSSNEVFRGIIFVAAMAAGFFGSASVIKSLADGGTPLNPSEPPTSIQQLETCTSPEGGGEGVAEITYPDGQRVIIPWAIPGRDGYDPEKFTCVPILQTRQEYEALAEQYGIMLGIVINDKTATVNGIVIATHEGHANNHTHNTATVVTEDQNGQLLFITILIPGGNPIENSLVGHAAQFTILNDGIQSNAFVAVRNANMYNYTPNYPFISRHPPLTGKDLQKSSQSAPEVTLTVPKGEVQLTTNPKPPLRRGIT